MRFPAASGQSPGRVLTRIAAHPISHLADLLPDRWKQGRSPAIPDSPPAAVTPATGQGPAPPA